VKQKAGTPDLILFFTIIVLLGFGIVMVFSSSAIKAYVRYDDSYYFLKKQLLWVAVGLSIMFFAMNYRYQRLYRLGKVALIGALVLLVLVLIPGIGVEVNGARRWLPGPVQFQPSELAKLCMVLFMARILTQYNDRITSFTRGVLPVLAILGVVFVLILKEPDLGTALAIAGTVFVMLFAAGAKVWQMIGLGASAFPLVGIAIWLEPYRLRRITSYLDPWSDTQGSGFQIIQSLYALGSGGLFGLGLGRSRQKFFYLPEQHTDFIYAILCEELGFIGGATVIILFFLFLWRGYKTAIYAPDLFGCLLAVGITTMVGLQALLNIAMVTGLTPITGISLPFISYGGSSLLFTMLGIGILLNISRYANQKAK